MIQADAIKAAMARRTRSLAEGGIHIPAPMLAGFDVMIDSLCDEINRALSLAQVDKIRDHASAPAPSPAPISNPVAAVLAKATAATASGPKKAAP